MASALNRRREKIPVLGDSREKETRRSFSFEVGTETGRWRPGYGGRKREGTRKRHPEKRFVARRYAVSAFRPATKTEASSTKRYFSSTSSSVGSTTSSVLFSLSLCLGGSSFLPWDEHDATRQTEMSFPCAVTRTRNDICLADYDVARFFPFFSSRRLSFLPPPPPSRSSRQRPAHCFSRDEDTLCLAKPRFVRMRDARRDAGAQKCTVNRDGGKKQRQEDIPRCVITRHAYSNIIMFH